MGSSIRKSGAGGLDCTKDAGIIVDRTTSFEIGSRLRKDDARKRINWVVAVNRCHRMITYNAFSNLSPGGEIEIFTGLLSRLSKASEYETNCALWLNSACHRRRLLRANGPVEEASNDDVIISTFCSFIVLCIDGQLSQWCVIRSAIRARVKNALGFRENFEVVSVYVFSVVGVLEVVSEVGICRIVGYASGGRFPDNYVLAATHFTFQESYAR